MDRLTLGSFWLMTVASRRPSGESDATSAPLDLTGLQGEGSWPRGYVLDTHSTEYPTGLRKQKHNVSLWSYR